YPHSPECGIGIGPHSGECGYQLLLLQHFALLPEEFEPTEHERVPDLLRLFQLLGRLAPVETDPATSMFLRAVDELLELRQRTLERKRLLDHHRLADREARQRLQGLLDAALLRIEMNAKEIQTVG